MALSEQQAGAPSASTTSSGYARKATGLVREISLVDMLAFNAAGPGGIVISLLTGLFYVFAAFPGGNLVLGLVIALLLVGFIWVTFALVGSVFPRVGGDYLYAS